ncbi:MAG: tetratricopeptide repeat protein, partial [Planctomycetota bacterium]
MTAPVDTIDSLHADNVDHAHWPEGQRICLLGRFGSMNRKQLSAVLRSHGGIVIPPTSGTINIAIVGADTPAEKGPAIPDGLQQQIDRDETEVMQEADLWPRLGYLDDPSSGTFGDASDDAAQIHRLYTPAMLADLLGISVRVIRRWHRLALIIPAKTVHRLPYFDFQEIATAKRLAEWVDAGASLDTIRQRLEELSHALPSVHRPLAQLSVIIEGKQVLLRRGEGLIEPSGQLRMDFGAAEIMDTDASSSRIAIMNSLVPVDDTDPDSSTLPAYSTFPGQSTLHDEAPATIRFSADATPPSTILFSSFTKNAAGIAEEDSLLAAAHVAEDSGDYATALDCYHAVAARDGARADIHFAIGELLYRMNEITAARERYFSAIETDDTFVEARASLGCVLAELGRHDLAIATFRGALSLYPDYADVHYNLAQALEHVGRSDDAVAHWQRFVELAPDSPWIDAAL